MTAGVRTIFRNFLGSIDANVSLIAAILAVPMIGLAGLAADYTHIYYAESNLQSSADSAALAAVKEMALVNIDKSALQKTAENYVYSNMSSSFTEDDTTIDVIPKAQASEITVNASYVWKPFLLHFVVESALPLKVSSTARLAGEGTICMLGLDDNLGKSIHLRKNAHLEAAGCGVYSNSNSTNALVVEQNGKLRAGRICSAGGFKDSKQTSFEPMPLVDCPPVGDPLANRPAPSAGACDYTGKEMKTGNHTLLPGTYCNGLKIKGDAKVRLEPGIYVISGDKLEVSDNATLEGENVGIYLDGDKAKLSFKKQTTISLTAPKTGLMAGILMFEDRTAFNGLLKHQITSDNARLLLGTIYLPNGTLRIDSQAPVGDKSAYTAIIARAIELDEGPTLHLNSDYQLTDIPLPEGLIKEQPYLAR